MQRYFMLSHITMTDHKHSAKDILKTSSAPSLYQLSLPSSLSKQTYHTYFSLQCEWLLESCILVIEPRTTSKPDYIPDCVALYHVLLVTTRWVDESLRSNITHGGQHGDSSVLQLSLTTSLEVLNAAIRCESSRIPKPHFESECAEQHRWSFQGTCKPPTQN